MKSSRIEFAINRLLIALDTASDVDEIAAMAAILARRWETSLEGVFLVDQGLRHAATLEVGRQIGLAPPRSVPLDAEQLEVQIEAMARVVEQHLRSAAGPTTKVTFRIVEGDPITRLRAAASERDLVVLSSGTRPITRYVRLQSSICRSANLLGRSVLILTERRLSDGTVILIDQPGAVEQRALAAALRLAELSGHLDIVVVSGASRLRHLDAALQDSGIEVRMHEVRSLDLPSLSEAVPSRTAGIVLGAASPLFVTPGVAALVEHFGCSVLIVNTT